MTDLISRSAALNSIEDWMDDDTGDEFDRGYDFAMRRAMRIIRNAPAIDAVPVVRCKDCIHAVAITNLTVANRCGLGQKNCMRQRGDDGFGFAGVSVVYPDGFCDEGARMDGESEEEG